MQKLVDNELTPFEKGMDFVLHFSGRKFTLADIKQRYSCTLRHAAWLRDRATKFVYIAPAGFEETETGHYRHLMEIRKPV